MSQVKTQALPTEVISLFNFDFNTNCQNVGL